MAVQLIDYIWGRQKTNSVVEWSENTVDVSVYIWRVISLRHLQLSINSAKSHFGFIIFDNPFTSSHNVVQHVVLSFVCSKVFLRLLWGFSLMSFSKDILKA